MTSTMREATKKFFLPFLLMMFAACASAEETSGTGTGWQEAYATFRTAVLSGNDAHAAELGDGFIDAAAADLNYHNPEFGRIALEVGTAHQRAGNLTRAADLIGQAHAAFVFSQGYADREAFDALALLAEVHLDADKPDDALRLYHECIAVSVIGGYQADQPGLLVGLADTYETLDPRIASAIRQSPIFPKQEK